jgi:murein L,D-transpeptidase YcbB/YkuD
MLFHSLNVVCGALVLLVVGYTAVRAEGWATAAAHELRQRLQIARMDGAPHCTVPDIDLDAAMIRFYQVRDFRPAWVDRYGLRPQGAMALAAVYRAADRGLVASDYRIPWLEELLDGMVSRPVIVGAAFEGRQVVADLAVTAALLRFAWHSTTGRARPAMDHFGPPAVKPSIDHLAIALAESLDRGNLDVFLDRLGPRHDGYRALQQQLPHYRKMARDGGWPVVDEGDKLALGDCGPRVTQLRDRLAAAGDLPQSAADADCFDEALSAALARFQQRHGLKPDGVAGAQTLAALNVPVAVRLRQIELSLERWRWLPADPGARHLLVNIPGFEMRVVESGRVVRTLRTVVGRQSRPTPELTSMVTYLEINPYWYVPHKIARQDLLPKIKANPAFIARQDFRVFDGWAPGARELDPAAIDWSAVSAARFPYRLRQEPAGSNALGRVKFIFPNPMDVYLHDTPAKGLFRKASRPFSSGCIRVEEPLDLVALLLAGQGWDAERVSRAVAANTRQVVVLDEPVPVYLVYLTAWVAPDGVMHFREDIYGRDQILMAALDQTAEARIACRQQPRLPVLAEAPSRGRQRL